MENVDKIKRGEPRARARQDRHRAHRSPTRRLRRRHAVRRLPTLVTLRLDRRVYVRTDGSCGRAAGRRAARIARTAWTSRSSTSTFRKTASRFADRRGARLPGCWSSSPDASRNSTTATSSIFRICCVRATRWSSMTRGSFRRGFPVCASCGRRATGARIEATLVERLDPARWRALARPAKRLAPGDRIRFGERWGVCLLGVLDATVEEPGRRRGRTRLRPLRR